MTLNDDAELRIELPKAELAVLHAYKQATGVSVREVIRGLLLEWSAKKVHEWTVGCRVAGINPIAQESHRDDVAVAPAIKRQID